MDIYSTRPIEEIDKLTYKSLISKKEVIISIHALNHLSARQRKVFKDEDLINMIKKERPKRTYLQKNGRYASYYRRKDGYRKLILEIEKEKITIVTFIDTFEIPRYKIEK